jgi:hypothetical protein
MNTMTPATMTETTTVAGGSSARLAPADYPTRALDIKAVYPTTLKLRPFEDLAKIPRGRLVGLLMWMDRCGIGRSRNYSQSEILQYAFGPKGWLRMHRAGEIRSQEAFFAAASAGLIEPYKPAGICWRLTDAGRALVAETKAKATKPA